MTKTYGHEQGLSACFRQWRAKSHCNKLHGYALAISIVIQAETLDERNWVVDFGALKPFKERLVELFDHKTLIAGDDPNLQHFMNMHERGLIDLKVMPGGVGCEAFAQHVHGMLEAFLVYNYCVQMQELGIKLPAGLAVKSVEVREHAGNSALYALPSPRLLTASIHQIKIEHEETHL
jgi:6-pyruvoyltetrahydropterin/6-carboxytetrahydropterin synthase